MDKLDSIDDHMLGAFIDGELDSTHSEIVMQAIRNDPDVRARVEHLRHARDLIKLAYGDVNPQTPARNIRAPGRSRLSGLTGIAASLALLTASFAMGYFGHALHDRFSTGQEGITTAENQKNMDRVILHISKSDPKHFGAVLAYTKNFLEKHPATSGQIEVVANAAGLDLLRSGVSPLENEVISLMREHPNVHFYACANAIRALRRKGIEPVLIQNVDTGMPAFDRIVGLLQDGWSYVKVDSLLQI